MNVEARKMDEEEHLPGSEWNCKLNAQLLEACQLDNTERLRLVLAAKPVIEDQDQLIAAAMYNGSYHALQLLLECGCYPNPERWRAECVDSIIMKLHKDNKTKQLRSLIRVLLTFIYAFGSVGPKMIGRVNDLGWKYDINGIKQELVAAKLQVELS